MEKGGILLFKRSEKKYLLTQEQYDRLISRISEYTVPDVYGQYSIFNIYYDTDDFSLIRHSLDGPRFKEKFRIRSYGLPKADQKVFLEIKKKYKGVVYKRRIVVPYSAARAYLIDGIPPEIPENEIATFKEIDYLIKSKGLKPKMFLAYDRFAYVAKDDKDFRVTFDYNIRSREDALDFAYGDGGDKLLADGEYLMELKAHEALPMWLVKILSELKIYPQSFSKYGRVYINLMKKRKGII